MKEVFEANDNPFLKIDEAHFYFCYWALENPVELHSRPLHNPKVMVWCAVYKATVIGPYFFKDNNGNYEENVCLSDVCGLSRMELWPTQPSFNRRASPSLRWPPHFQVSWHSLPAAPVPLVSPFVIISCGDTLRHVCMNISPVHLSIWKKLFTLTE